MKLPRFMTNPRLPPDHGYWEYLDSIAGFCLIFLFLFVVGVFGFCFFL